MTKLIRFALTPWQLVDMLCRRMQRGAGTELTRIEVPRVQGLEDGPRSHE